MAAARRLSSGPLINLVTSIINPFSGITICIQTVKCLAGRQDPSKFVHVELDAGA